MKYKGVCIICLKLTFLSLLSNTTYIHRQYILHRKNRHTMSSEKFNKNKRCRKIILKKKEPQL